MFSFNFYRLFKKYTSIQFSLQSSTWFVFLNYSIELVFQCRSLITSTSIMFNLLYDSFILAYETSISVKMLIISSDDSLPSRRHIYVVLCAFHLVVITLSYVSWYVRVVYSFCQNSKYFHYASHQRLNSSCDFFSNSVSLRLLCTIIALSQVISNDPTIAMQTFYLDPSFLQHRRSVGKNSEGAQQWRCQDFVSGGHTTKQFL